MNNKSWLKHYDPDVPYTLAPYPERTLIDVVSESANQRPNHPALLFQGNTVSYKELAVQSQDIVNCYEYSSYFDGVSGHRELR